MIHWYVWTRVMFISLSGFLWGYNVGSINGVKDMEGYRLAINLSYNLPMTTNTPNSTVQSCDSQDDIQTGAILGWVVSLLSVGCLFGALTAGVLSDFAGRKPAVIIGSFLASFGGILHLAAVNLWMVLLSRLIGGLGVGILYQVTPLYIAEISPEKLRGRMLSLIAVYATVGFVAGNVVNLIVKNFLFGWRISVGIQFVVAAVLALGMLLLPRSPRWLAKKNEDDGALKVLCKIYQDEDEAMVHLKEIKLTLSSTNESFVQTFKYILQWKFRILLGFSMMLLGRLSGLNFITHFSVSIFCGIGLPGFVGSVVLSLINFLFMLLSLFTIDKLGRKPIFLIGIIVMLLMHIGSATVVLVFQLEEEPPEEGFSASQRVAGYFVLVMVCLFLGSGTISVGSIPWVMVGEIFPLRGRGVMIAVSNTGFWIGLILVNQLSPILSSSVLNVSGTLYLFASITFILLLFVLLLLPETKDKTLEKVEELFSKPWLERTNVLYYLSCGCFKELRIGKGRRGRKERRESQKQLRISMDQSNQLDSMDHSNQLDSSCVDEVCNTNSEAEEKTSDTLKINEANEVMSSL